MKKNLLDKEASNRLVQRIHQLRVDTQPNWGKMTATEMLLHCNKVHQQLLSPSASTPRTTSPKQYLLRWVVLYLIPRFPKGARAPKQYHTKGTIGMEEFEKQKKLFIELLERFPGLRAINHFHPYFGALTTKQWGLAGWKHIDHHLRQFGV